MKKYFILLIFLSAMGIVYAQEQTFDVVPKQYSLETGFRYNFSNDFQNNQSYGYGFLLDYAWQLSGFANKKASFISVPLGYTLFQSLNDSANFSILSYGWTVRHELAKNKKWIPYLGYSLLLNQLKTETTVGSIMGHKTGLGGGIQFIPSSKYQLYMGLEYSYSRFMILDADKGKKIQGAEFKFGVRI
jgi:hypothetical protein